MIIYDREHPKVLERVGEHLAHALQSVILKEARIVRVHVLTSSLTLLDGRGLLLSHVIVDFSLDLGDGVAG